MVASLSASIRWTGYQVTTAERYQIIDGAAALRIVDCIADPLHPEAGAAVCFIGGDSRSAETVKRAEMVACALNAYEKVRLVARRSRSGFPGLIA